MSLTPDNQNLQNAQPGPAAQKPAQEAAPGSPFPSGPPSPPPPLSPPPFGGAPVPPAFGAAPFPSQPPKKSRKGLFIFLFILGGFLILSVVIVLGVGAVIKDILGTSPGPMSPPRGGNVVGVVRIDTVIMDARKTIEILRHYQEQDRIRAVLIRVDSPGGAVGASQEIYDAIGALRKSGKKVVASLGNVAASGGYYVACAADEVYANPGTLTGSIGVIFSVPNLEGISEKVGIRYQVIKSGKFKDVGSMTRTMTPEEQKLLQGVIDDTYNQFIEAIMKHRTQQIAQALAGSKTDAPQVEAELGGDATPEQFLRQIADGRVFTGRQAHKYGLVDTLGTEEDAVKRLANLAGIHKPETYEYKPRRTFLDLFEAEAKSALSGAALPLSGPRLEYRLPF